MDKQVKYPSRVAVMNPQYRLLYIVAIAIIAGVSDAVSDDLTALSLVGGFAANVGEFPYVASVRRNGTHYCGGVIVDARHVLTAAHCVPSFSFPHATTTVMTGSIRADEGRLHDIKSITNHFLFNEHHELPSYDISIIALKKNITFDRFQSTINLPHGPVPSGVTATVIGWGKTYHGAPGTAPYLRKMDTTTLGHNECLEHLEEGAVLNKDSEICTLARHGVGICDGDSGGPLVYNGNVIGLVSSGFLCAEGYSDVYANVSYFVPWIREKIAETYSSEGPSNPLRIVSTHFENILKTASALEGLNP